MALAVARCLLILPAKTLRANARVSVRHVTGEPVAVADTIQESPAKCRWGHVAEVRRLGCQQRARVRTVISVPSWQRSLVAVANLLD